MTACEFCEGNLSGDAPDNLALLAHLDTRRECREQFEHLLENIRTSWTSSMSGG